MSITTISQLEDAASARYTKIFLSKININSGNHGAGFNVSFWQSSGTPGVGLTPTTTVAALSNATTGAIPFTQQTSPRTSYLPELNAYTPGTVQSIEVHDRLIHIASAVSTTAQTVTGFDLNSFLATNNIGNRIGDANYSDVQWWIEVIADGSTTTSNLTVTVTYNDGTSGNLTTIAAFTNRRQARMYALNNLIPAADSGKYIRAITSVVGSASSTGAIAFVATRYRVSILPEYPSQVFKSGWTDTGLPEIYNQSCLFPIIIAPGTVISNVVLDGIIAHG